MVQNITYGLNLRSGREQSTVRRPSIVVVTRDNTKAQQEPKPVTEWLVGLALITMTTLFGGWLFWSLARALETYRVF